MDVHKYATTYKRIETQIYTNSKLKEEKNRIYITLPSNTTEDEAFNEFESFGTLEYFKIFKKPYKTFGFALYFDSSSAHIAMNQCNKKYKPVWANPRQRSLLDGFKKATKDKTSYLPEIRSTSHIRMAYRNLRQTI